jgi:pimeloyl-ACP methyl ester carboxylesterase
LSQFNFAENPAALEELDADDRALAELARRDPDAAAQAAAERTADWVREMQEHPESLLDNLPEADRPYFDDLELRRMFLDAVREGVRQGPEALAWEMIDVYLPWGFRLADIGMEVHVFHGEQDAWVERRHVDFIVETLPNAKLTVWPGAGHGAAHHWGEVLEAVA